MFAVIEFREKQNRFKRGKITSERIPLPSGDVFFVVRVEKSFGKVPWKKLERCLGILRQCVILPEGEAVPENVNMTVFTPDIFPRLLLINSAADYIARHRSGFLSRSLTVFDEKGIYTPYIENLLHCFSNIKIVTPVREEYEKLSRQLMENYGFSLLITDKETCSGDTVISHRCNIPVYFKGDIFTNEKKYLMNTKAFCGSDIILPEFYEMLRPQGVGRVLFASALYEKCSVTQLKDLKYEDFGC